MIRRKEPGPCKNRCYLSILWTFYSIFKNLLLFFVPLFFFLCIAPDEDKIGPVVLAVMLASAITVNFAVKLYDVATGRTSKI